MKIGLYSPYLPDHFGGGEKYFLDAASVYAQAGHQVLVAINEHKHVNLTAIKAKYHDFFQLDLTGVDFVPSPLGNQGDFWRKLSWTKQLDVFYVLSDGSAPLSLAKRNMMHIQQPLLLPPKKGWDKFKFNRFQVINTNSKFTKTIVEKHWGINVDLVCQPGVKAITASTPATTKQPLILNVGRFFAHSHSKRQDVLVTMWQELLCQEPALTRDWSLVLIGGVEDEAYLQRVRSLAKNLPVTIITNASRATLADYYRRASIYWHATGFGLDEQQDPIKMEHFGITTVEAMTTGAIPIVIGKAGQKEVLGKHLAELGWQGQAECLALTTKVIKNAHYRGQLREQVIRQAQKFSPAVFASKHLQMLKSKY